MEKSFNLDDNSLERLIAIKPIIAKVPEAEKFKHLIGIEFEDGKVNYNFSKLPERVRLQLQDAFPLSK